MRIEGGKEGRCICGRKICMDGACVYVDLEFGVWRFGWMQEEG